MYWGPGCSVDRNLEVRTSLLHYCTFGLGAANDAQNFREDIARRKDNDQQNVSKMIIWYRSVYNQTASDAWRYNNPVYKLMTDRLQLMLINVLLDQFLSLNIKVSQGSVTTRLNDMKSLIIGLLRNNCWVREWKILKIGQHLPKLWAIRLSTGLFFYETRCIFNKIIVIVMHVDARCNNGRINVSSLFLCRFFVKPENKFRSENMLCWAVDTKHRQRKAPDQ